jgi:hypothetical protein
MPQNSATAKTALTLARTHLNDEMGRNWPDQKLMPKLQAAYQEMMAELTTNGVPIINNVSTIMTVIANVVDDNNVDLSQPASISAGTYPTNMLEPIWMKERSVGQANADFVDMTKVDYIPQLPLSGNQLVWWAWMNGVIMLRGCLTPVQVQLRFRQILTPPKKNTDLLTVTNAETFLGAETAYLAMISLPDGNRGIITGVKSLAERNLENVIAEAVKGLQNLPAKRRPYHRGRGRSRAIRDF